jgi:prepilin-type N-terminal cleavage/methylation domain-containing protein
MRRLNKNNLGFTLVEMMVSITVMVILMLAAILSYNKVRQEIALQRAVYKLAQDVRKMQGMAAGAEIASDCVANPDYKYKFGIFVKTADPNKYILYSDCNNNDQYDAGTDYLVPLELVDFDVVDLGGNAFADLDVLFYPPDPFVLINKDGDKTALDASIIIRIKSDPTKTKTVFINKAGLIDVQ